MFGVDKYGKGWDVLNVVTNFASYKENASPMSH
jgi:hypothetical protein